MSARPARCDAPRKGKGPCKARVSSPGERCASHNSNLIHCGARTVTGGTCRLVVDRQGQRCPQHEDEVFATTSKFGGRPVPGWMVGRTVKDARKPVTINIRREHIDQAVALNGQECVAGRCALQALGASYAYFYRSKAYIAWDDDQPIMRYQVSHALYRDVITILDDSGKSNDLIKPGLYELRPPTATQRLGRDRSNKNPGARAKHVSHRTHAPVLGRIATARTL